MPAIAHHLPGEGPNTDWFARFNPFEQQETRRQVAFRRDQWPDAEDGPHCKFTDHTYPHILPAGPVGRAFYPPLAQAILDYCDNENIAVHTEVLNLRSSQACCLNVMFPLRQDLQLAAKSLAGVLPGVQRVLKIEFEFTGPPAATRWLGEPENGQRGRNRTSIDVAIWWEDQRRRILTLGEWKYTERSYGLCGGFASRGNRNKLHCQTAAYPACASGCYLTVDRNHRRYWEHSPAAGIDPQLMSKVQGCPFRGPFYQLWRQTLLAALLRGTESLEVEVLLLSFAGNQVLTQCPPELAPLGKTVIEAWNAALDNRAPAVRHAHVDTIVQIARGSGQASPEWLAYLAARYGL